MRGPIQIPDGAGAITGAGALAGAATQAPALPSLGLYVLATVLAGYGVAHTRLGYLRARRDYDRDA